MHFWVQPGRIVERSSFYEHYAWHCRDIGEDGRAALRAEVSVNRLTAIARVMKRLNSSLN
jgi:hypothetical protein